jgi:hypothetical protein
MGLLPCLAGNRYIGLLVALICCISNGNGNFLQAELHVSDDIGFVIEIRYTDNVSTLAGLTTFYFMKLTYVLLTVENLII